MSFNLLDNILGFPTLTHVQRAYNWDFILPDLWGILISGVVVSKYCQSIKFGQYNIADVEEVRAGAIKKFYPISTDIEPATATFISPVPDLVLWYFSSWKDRMMDKKGRFRTGVDYKKTGTIVLYDRSGIPSNLIRLVKMFPIKFPDFNLDYSSETVHKFEVTFRYERTEMGLSALGNTISGVAGAVGGAVGKVGSLFGIG